ncbi:MAG: hypothetical protein IPO64_13235 [Bacteroidetes bacterium]|nr:hypothetical protein [Bacteroidota bacterium]
MFSIDYNKISSNTITNTELSAAFNYGTSVARLGDGTIRIAENTPYTAEMNHKHLLE